MMGGESVAGQACVEPVKEFPVNGMLLKGERPSYLQKVSRLRERLSDPKWRRYGLTLLAGKMIALLVLAAVIVVGSHLPEILFGGSHAMAQTTAPCRDCSRHNHRGRDATRDAC